MLDFIVPFPFLTTGGRSCSFSNSTEFQQSPNTQHLEQSQNRNQNIKKYPVFLVPWNGCLWSVTRDEETGCFKDAAWFTLIAELLDVTAVDLSYPTNQVSLFSRAAGYFFQLFLFYFLCHPGFLLVWVQIEPSCFKSDVAVEPKCWGPLQWAFLKLLKSFKKEKISFPGRV